MKSQSPPQGASRSGEYTNGRGVRYLAVARPAVWRRSTEELGYRYKDSDMTIIHLGVRCGSHKGCCPVCTVPAARPVV